MQRSRRLFAGAALALAVPFVLAGCVVTQESTTGSEPGDHSDPTPSATATPLPVLAIADTGFQAGIHGELVVTDENCVGLKRSDGTIRPAAFPHGTAVQFDGGGITVPGHGDVAFGELVTGAGGYMSGEAAVAAGELFPEECRADKLVLFSFE